MNTKEERIRLINEIKSNIGNSTLQKKVVESANSKLVSERVPTKDRRDFIESAIIEAYSGITSANLSSTGEIKTLTMLTSDNVAEAEAAEARILAAIAASSKTESKK